MVQGGGAQIEQHLQKSAGHASGLRWHLLCLLVQPKVTTDPVTLFLKWIKKFMEVTNLCTHFRSPPPTTMRSYQSQVRSERCLQLLSG